MKPIATILVALLAASCSTVSTSAEYDRSRDFSHFHTWAWGPSGGASSPQVEQKIRDVIDAQLSKKGLVRVDGAADLEVRYRAAVAEAPLVQVWGTSYGGRWSGVEPDTHLLSALVGSVVVEVFDAQSRQLAWRGVGTGDLTANATLEERARTIDSGAAQMFAQFPAGR